MGHNESKAPSKFKISQNNGSNNVTVGSNLSSPEIASASALYYKEDRTPIDLNKTSNGSSKSDSEIIPNKTINDFRDQGNIKSLLQSENSDLTNLPLVPNHEHEPLPLTARRLQLHPKESTIFDRTQPKIEENKEQTASVLTRQPKLQKDEKQSFLFVSAQSQAQKDDNKFVDFPSTQPQIKNNGNVNHPDLFTMTQENKNKNQSLFLPTSQPLEKKNETQLNSEPNRQEDIHQSVQFSTTQPQREKHENQTFLCFTIEPQVEKDDNQGDPLSATEGKGQKDDKHPFISFRAESQGESHGNQHVDFFAGQPLMQIANLSSPPQKPKDSQPVILNTNKVPKAKSIAITTKPVMENKSLKKVISSGNPFLQSSTRGMVAKDVFEISVNEQSLVIPPNSDSMPQITEAKSSSVNESLFVPNIESSNCFNVPLSVNEDKLSVGAMKKKRSPLRVAGLKGSPENKIFKNTLKHVEMIAESLTSSSDKNRHQQESVVSKFTDFQSKERHNHYTLHDCIEKMKNIRDNDKDFISSLQKELVTHLKEMALFTSVLKTCSVVNADVYSICEAIRENVSVVKTNYEIKNIQRINDAIYTTKEEAYKNYESKNPVFLFKENHINDIAYTNSDKTNLFAASGTVIKEIKTENNENKTNTIDLNPFMALLDQLPDDLIEEKQNISLYNTQLYCRICEKHIVFVLLNLVEHLRGKNHCALATSKQKSTPISKAEIQHFPCTNDSLLTDKPTSPEPSGTCLANACQTQQPKEPSMNIKLFPHYEGILNLISQSVKESFSIGVEVYICLLCDYLGNDNNKALTHVRTDHKYEQKSVWHYCEICLINIYGTNLHFKEHCLTTQHINIEKSKDGKLVDELSKEKGSVDRASMLDELDQGSVCSSKSDTSNKSRSRLKPHEILLAIVKDQKDKNIKGPFGLYCQICNKYSTETMTLTDHLNTQQHIQSSGKQNFRRKLSSKECTTCEIYLFGDNDVWKEHKNLEMHKELLASAYKGKFKRSSLEETNQEIMEEIKNHDISMANRFNSRDPNVSESNSVTPSNPEDVETDHSGRLLSFNESGPHYEFMKKVLKKHFDKNLDNVYGLYCDFCQLYFLEQEEWDSHLSSNSHRTRLNSLECVGTIVEHDCANCNIHLICNETFFSLHLQSLAHNAISRIPGKRQVLEESESDEDSEDDYSDDYSENDDEKVENEVNNRNMKHGIKGNINSTNSREARTNKLVIVPNGIYLTGLPKDFKRKALADYFMKYGPLQSYKVNNLQGSGCVVYKNKIDANTVLHKKTVYINRTPVVVKPLMERPRRINEIPALNPDVVKVLSSWKNVEDAVSGLLSEMTRNFNYNQQKADEIKRDLSAMVPDCRILFFGSQVTGLATGSSDFDIYIDIDGKSFYTDISYDEQHRIIQFLQYRLTQRGSRFVVKETILEARVPIIRLLHMGNHSLCDISCRSGLSVENSQLVRLYLEMDPRVRWLVVAVKYWMRANGLLDRTAFTSYATVWLVLFFLMRVTNPVICPVVILQRNCKPHTVARWDCRFHRVMRDVYSLFRTSNRQSNLQLLALFFQMYATCPYKKVVLCPLNGCLLTRKQFETLRLPSEFGPYVDKIQFSKDGEKLKIQTPICLQDPFDLSHNVTKGVNRTDLLRFKSHCNQSYKMCQHLMTRYH